MNTHREPNLERVVKTALAREMMEGARSPVEALAVPIPAGRTQTTGALPKARPMGIKKILVPTDFSPLAEQAVRYARCFGEQFGAEIILLHVTDPVTYAPAYCPLEAVEELRATRHQTALDALAELTKNTRPSRGPVAPCRSMIAEGDPARETDRIAAELKVDLIIIATHGFTGFKHLLLGSTAEKTVRSAPCPILVVRDTRGVLSLSSESSGRALNGGANRTTRDPTNLCRDRQQTPQSSNP